MAGVIIPAYAKLNLTLDVISVRADGYHEIASVMQTVSLHDLLLVERSDCRIFEMIGPPIEGENLVLKAARELEAHAGRTLPFKIRLHKRIPMGAGLGGGSADAAAFLRVAPGLYDLALSRDAIHEIATAVGHDVPFLMQGGTARATGLGSTLEWLRPLDSSWACLVVCPRVPVSTREVYQVADTMRPSARRTDAVVAVVQAGSSPGADLLGNDLEAATLTRYPAVEAAIAPLRAMLPQLRMTGTGSAFYAAFPTLAAARVALARTDPSALDRWICRPVPGWS
jgi:4-diphosphocytidyl-2-C-methyl-D-erythritol kinase